MEKVELSVFIHVATAVEVDRRAVIADNHRGFFVEYCVRCHGLNEAKGELQVDAIPFTIDSIGVSEKWQKILNSLNAGEMPPEDQKQPPNEIKADFLD